MNLELEKTAAAYIRVSTEEQTELSPDSQLKEIRKYAAQHGIELLEEHIYIDAGISGRNTAKRPEFNKMISFAKSKPKPFDVILLWKFSRFARNREDSIVYKSMLRKECGIDVLSISEALGDDNTSVLIEALIEAMDEYYSLNLATETKRGLREKVERGGIITVAPFGYKIKDGCYVIFDEQAKIIRSLFEDYMSGVSVRELAIRLNNKGILTNRGTLWKSKAITYILSNPVYIGKIRWSPDNEVIIAQGIHEPIVSDELFGKVQERLAYIASTFKRGEHKMIRLPDFMLRGLVKCSNCGSTLVNHKKGTSLQCCTFVHGQCTVSHCVTKKAINEAVIERIREDLDIGDFNVAPSIVHNDENNDSEEQIERLSRKLIRAAEAFENGAYDLAFFKERKAAIEKELGKLKAKKKLKKDVPQNARKRKDSIRLSLALLTDPEVSETEKNLALRKIIDKVVFNRGENKILVFYR
jgi:DNA invertase Pin-like site-specific DNA recombinase